MRVIGYDGQQRAARKALVVPKAPRAPLRPRGGVAAGGRSQHLSPSREVRVPHTRSQFHPHGLREPLGGRHLSLPGLPHEHGGGFGRIGHVVGGTAHGVGALANEVFAKPVEYSKYIAQGRHAKADQARHEMEATSRGLAKGLAPQSLLDIAHGHRPSGKHLGEDALFFLPFSRGLRAAGEGIKAASEAEAGVRAAEGASRAAESYKSGKGVAGGLAGAAKRLTPSERALRSSPARKELFQHLDATLEPSHAKAEKGLFDKSVKAMVRNGNARNVHEAAGRLIHVRSEIAPHEIPQDLKGLYQHEKLPVPHMPEQLDAKAIAKEIRASHGHLLPQKLRVPGALERAINRTYEHVKLGAGYRDWYKRYAGVVHDVAASDKLAHVSPRQLAQLISVYSQRAMPTENLRRAVVSAVQHGDFGYFQGQAEKAKKILEDPTWFEQHYLPSQAGPKVSNYYANALQHLDPAHYAEMFHGKPAPVTIDTHMNQMLTGQDRVPDRQYDSLAEVFRHMGHHLGWDPSEVQAAAWVSKKATNEAENTALKMRAKGVKFAQRPASEYLHSSGDAYERAYDKYNGTLFQHAQEQAPRGFTQHVLDTHAGHDLEGLPNKIKVAGKQVEWHSYKPAQDLAESYMEEAGLPYHPPLGYAKVDPERAKRIADWYDHAIHAPLDPEVAQAYDAMATETLAQYHDIIGKGYKFEFYPEGADPYPHGPRQAILDLIQNKHMYVFPTEGGFGTEAKTLEHPLLADSGVRWGGKTVTHNDIFRAVHDFFGHAKEGVGFRADGEENAWRSHSAMYSPEARKAMTSETRGQNSWVNFGPHGEANRTANQLDTVYADQKAVVAPDWVVHEGAGKYDHLTTDELHGRLEAINGSYSGVLDQLAAGEGRPGDYKRLTAYQNANAKRMIRRTGKPYPTVTQQLRDHAEGKLTKFLEENGHHPLVQRFNADQAEGDEIRREISRRNDTLFQAEEPPSPRSRLFDHIDRNVAPPGNQLHKELFDESVKNAVKEGEHPTAAEARLAAVHAHFANPGDTLFQSDVPGFHQAAAQELHNYGALARDVAKTLPENEWPAWVRNQLERQSSGAAEHLLADAGHSGETFPEDWLKQGDFTEPPKSAGEVAIRATQKAGTTIKGAFEHMESAHGAIIHLTKQADVTTFPHELGHFLRRYGLNAEHEARLSEWAGVKNGVWDRAAEEKFARGLEKMIRQGDAPNNLVEEFRRLEPAFREMYPQAGHPLPTVPADIAQVYKEILGHRDGPQALYWTLHNALIGHQLANEARQGPPRSPEEAQQHVLEASRLAAEEGHGRILPKVESLKEGETSVATGGKAGAEVRRGLVGVGTQRNEQEAVREVQRSRKAGSLRSAQQDALKADSPAEALTTAGGARAGALEHSSFENFHGLRDYLDELATHIIQHPHLKPFEKQNAWEAILNGVDGQVPRKFEQKLLERAFGKQEGSLAQQLKSGTFGEKIANVANIPRALMASGDLSAPFRQGLVVLASHPGEFFKGFGPMLRSAKSEETFQAGMKALHEMPTYALADKAGLSITEIGDEIGAREEQFASNMAEHLHELPGVRSTPGVKHVAKGASTIVRGSDRAYVLFLNRTRMRLFDTLVSQAAEEGYHLNDKLTGDIARFVNSATGRGDLGKLKDHAATLNTLFFSPRLLKSRLDFLNPAYYMSMEPFARKQALRAALRLAGTLSTVLMFARLGGATVVADPRNADFGKIRIGNTRLDIAGGFTQPLRLISQLYTGQIVSSTTGRLEPLTSSGFGRSRLDVVSQFLEGKAAPVPSTIIDLLRGSQFGGTPITAQGEIANHMVPLLWQDLASVYHSTGPKGLAAYGPEDLFGVGVQNYGAPGPKTKKDTSTLEKQSLQAGLGKPPAQVEADVQWKAQLDANTYTGMTPLQRATEAVKLYDKRYHTTLETSILPALKTQGQAEALYSEIRARLFPSLQHWQSAVNKVLGAQKSEEPVPQQTTPKKSSAPAPPRITDAQNASYRIPAHAASQGVDAAHHTIIHAAGGHAAYIAQAARQHGLDPQAVLAVASQEGLSGGVGDGGTSFGPFQLHEGGALPASVAAKGARYAQQWAWSPAGINYALGHMASVAKGLHGQAAVNAIVSRFERPANIGAEEAGAMRAYGGPISAGAPQFGGGTLGGPIGPQGGRQSNLSQAADTILESLASGNYNPIKVFTALSNQPLQNTMEMPGFGHVRFQIPKITGPVGKAARGAIALAQAYLGTPYVWGGESPRGFDCSGLLQYIYAKQGVSIPRTSQEQWRAGARVPRSQLRPGDAVFFAGSDGSRGAPGHVGIYIGHGKFIESPHTGATVRISNLAGYPGYVGARRYAQGERRRKAA